MHTARKAETFVQAPMGESPEIGADNDDSELELMYPEVSEMPSPISSSLSRCVGRGPRITGLSRLGREGQRCCFMSRAHFRT